MFVISRSNARSVCISIVVVGLHYFNHYTDNANIYTMKKATLFSSSGTPIPNASNIKDGYFVKCKNCQQNKFVSISLFKNKSENRKAILNYIETRKNSTEFLRPCRICQTTTVGEIVSTNF